MKCRIMHESRGRIRVRAMQKKMTYEEADILEAYLKSLPFVVSANVSDRLGDVVICYTDRADVIAALSEFSYSQHLDLIPAGSDRALSAAYQEKLVMTVFGHFAKKLFLPFPIRCVLTVIEAAGYVKKGIETLLRKKLQVPVLDATAIVMAIVTRDFDTASSIMFLLRIGDLLEEWTHKKSVSDLAEVMSLNIDKVWIRTPEGEEVLVSLSSVEAGDLIVVRTSGMIPLDGMVVEGEGSVNEASMTGESLPVAKAPGSLVYAGTVMEDGECVIRVTKAAGSGRYDRIVKMIEESEKLKSSTEAKASHLADHLVPYSLGGTLAVGALTRNMTRAMAVLMVDYSCALKLAMPLSVLSAMREAGEHHISVKGGRFMEAAAEADIIVFDKTGTLTHACPRVAEVIPFGEWTREEALRLAACLEEHYPHSMAKAVVDEAARCGIEHREMHTKVNYIVAHGISSTIEDKNVLIGSTHFVFEDEGCLVPEKEKDRFEAISDEYSHLFLAVGGQLAAVICIEDPLREEAAEVVKSLHELGIRRCVMMTGDNKKTARRIAEMVGVDECYGEVLPEDKAAYIKKAREEGHKVIMVGDGVNDSPALSEADVGIAISDGAAIAREIADITIMADDLRSLVTLRRLSMALMDRINSSYRFIMGFNSALIALGVFGVLVPGTTSLLHNLSTLAIGLKDMTDLLEEDR